ncbi:PAS domain-containing protein [Marinibaculum pumilum]|uniref:PAS domain-containing protein n=2 Tax=Marinibaculum pumilum TaxID=1766165 RepID=A0ABV7L3P6_9PROT
MAGIVPVVQRQLFAHWDSLRGDAQTPERRSFRPERLPRSLVPHIGLLKVDRGAGRLGFEYRIVGNAIARTFGTGATRKRPADDRPTAYSRPLEAFYALGVETRAATSWTAANLIVGGGETLVHRICLPLCAGLPGEGGAAPEAVQPGQVTALLFSTVAEPGPDGRAPEEFQGRLIVGIAPRLPFRICARQHPTQAVAA